MPRLLRSSPSIASSSRTTEIFIIILILFIIVVHMLYVHECVCYSVHVEVRGNFVELNISCLYVGFRDWIQVIRLTKHIYLPAEPSPLELALQVLVSCSVWVLNLDPMSLQELLITEQFLKTIIIDLFLSPHPHISVGRGKKWKKVRTLMYQGAHVEVRENLGNWFSFSTLFLSRVSSSFCYCTELQPILLLLPVWLCEYCSCDYRCSHCVQFFLHRVLRKCFYSLSHLEDSLFNLVEFFVCLFWSMGAYLIKNV